MTRNVFPFRAPDTVTARVMYPLAALAGLALGACIALSQHEPEHHAGAAMACTAAPPPVASGAAPGSTWISHELPPARYRGDASAPVRFVDPDKIGEICAPGLPPLPCGHAWAACTGVNLPHRMTVPNPCSRPGDEYADLLCHELGHVKGWPATHGE